jgi:hypothetical protein
MIRQKGTYRPCQSCGNEFFVYNFRIGDSGRGKFCSKTCYYKSRKGKRVSIGSEFKKGEHIGSDHWLWTGEEVCYGALHVWLTKNFNKNRCERCGSAKNLQWANKDGQYLRDRSNWEVLCGSCHAKEDHADPKLIKSRFLSWMNITGR